MFVLFPLHPSTVGSPGETQVKVWAFASLGMLDEVQGTINSKERGGE